MFAADRDGSAAEPAGRDRVTWADYRRAWLAGPLSAVRFLTILPIAPARATQPHELGPAEAFFPLAGLLIGGVLVGLDTLLTSRVSSLVRDVLLVATVAVLSGAIHLDGIVDTFDGLFAPGGRDRRLEIMRDPRAGSFGVIAVILVLSLKVAALGDLAGPGRTAALLLGPCLGRWTIVVVTYAFRYARPEGSGRSFKAAISPVHVSVAGSIVVLAAWLAAGLMGLGAGILISGFALALGFWWSSRLGGLTGDTYGAICELSETTTWLLFGLHFGSLSLVGMPFGDIIR